MALTFLTNEISAQFLLISAIKVYENWKNTIKISNKQ